MGVSLKKRKKKEVTTMPRGDGTEPRGQGPGTGRGVGRGQGGGRGGGFAAGPGRQLRLPEVRGKSAASTGLALL